MHIVMAGDPVGGFTCHGPFETALEAYDYAHNGPDTEHMGWWVVPLNAPLSQWKRTVPRGETICLFCGNSHSPTEPVLDFGTNPGPPAAMPARAR